MKLTKTPEEAVVRFVVGRARLAVRGLELRGPKGGADARRLFDVDVTRAVARGLGMFDNIRGVQFHTEHMLRAARMRRSAPLRSRARRRGADLICAAAGMRTRAAKLVRAW